MQRFLAGGNAVRHLVMCGEQKRQAETGPRNIDDLKAVIAAAKAGAQTCQALLGRWYELGEGVARDYQQAAQWYLRAAAGRPELYVELGRMAERGWGRPASNEDALALYRKASDADTGEGHLALARMAELGKGMPADLAAAAGLYRKAAARGKDQGWEHLDRLEARHKMFSIGQVADDRRRWMGLLMSKVATAIGEEPRFRAFNTGKGAQFALTFNRGNSAATVELKKSSGAKAFDALALATLAKVSMPQPPIYSSETNYRVLVPVRNESGKP
ncbi:tetratricopeptide repeat protein [Massilia glaciei]|nr:tetratricopeptide repeat protein [Massilia glaciei]